MNDQLVPHNMTVFQAVKTFGLVIHNSTVHVYDH